MNKRVIVTGGAGFIGSHLVDFLLKRNFEVLVLDNLSSGKLGNVNKNALFININICNQSKLSQIFSDFNPKYVFHLAGKSTENCQKDNVLGTKNIVKACISSKVEMLVFTSSVSVYGNTGEKSAKENNKLNPINTYGKSKLNAEKTIINNYKLNTKLHYSILRLSNVYGPRQKFDKNGGVVSIFCFRIKNNKSISIFGDGKQKRDFIYISDVINAIYKSSKSKNNIILNISSGMSIDLLGLTKLILKNIDRKVFIRYLPKRTNEINLSIVNSNFAQKILKWDLMVKCDKGIKKTFKYV